MFSRYFWTFCTILLVAAFATASAEQTVEIDYDEQSLEIAERSKIGKTVEKILKSFFKHLTEDCLKSAVDKCKKHWYNPSKVIQCAKDFFSIENAGCLVGAYEQSVLVLESTQDEVEEDLSEVDESSFENAERSKIGKAVEKILKKFFKHLTEDCLKSAVAKCKKHWYNPSKVIQCAKDFLSIENAGCLVGAYEQSVLVLESTQDEVEEDLSEVDESSFENAERSKIGKAIEKVLKKFFKHLTEDCLKSAVAKCKKHWYNPSKIIKCAKNFFSIENAGCLVGARDESDFEIAERSKIGKTVEKILKSFFKHLTGDCLKSAVDKCKKHWYNPSKVIQCAKDFFSIENAGCLVGA